MNIILGRTLFHTETGTEGGHWAVQDAAHVSLDRFGQPSASYEGLEVLKDGDYLYILGNFYFGGKTLHSAEFELVKWHGEIDLEKFDVFTEHVEGWWVHSAQRGIDRVEWAKMFFYSQPVVLIQEPDASFDSDTFDVFAAAGLKKVVPDPERGAFYIQPIEEEGSDE